MTCFFQHSCSFSSPHLHLLHTIWCSVAPSPTKYLEIKQMWQSRVLGVKPKEIFLNDYLIYLFGLHVFMYAMLACMWKQPEIILHTVNCRNGIVSSFFIVLSSWFSSFTSLTGCSRIGQCLQYLPMPSIAGMYCQETVKLLEAQRFQNFFTISQWFLLKNASFHEKTLSWCLEIPLLESKNHKSFKWEKTTKIMKSSLWSNTTMSVKSQH